MLSLDDNSPRRRDLRPQVIAWRALWQGLITQNLSLDECDELFDTAAKPMDPQRRWVEGEHRYRKCAKGEEQECDSHSNHPFKVAPVLSDGVRALARRLRGALCCSEDQGQNRVAAELRPGRPNRSGPMRCVLVDLRPHRRRRVPPRIGEPSMEMSPEDFVRHADRGLV